MGSGPKFSAGQQVPELGEDRVQTSHGSYVLDDSLARMDFSVVHGWLTQAYWSPSITRAEVEHGFRHSTIVVGAYLGDEQVGCLRVTSDRTRFAYIMDVFVAPAHRGRGLGKALTRAAIEHPDLALVYKWALATHDAHAVYRAVGFTDMPHPERWMALLRERPWLKDE